MGFKLVKLGKPKTEMVEQSVSYKLASEETRQGITGLTDGRDKVNAMTLVQAKDVARRTRELLDTQGWCLWQCSALGGEVIAVIRDENVTEIPKACPTYTEDELEQLFQKDISQVTLRLVHEAKKLAGAKVIGNEE